MTIHNKFIELSEMVLASGIIRSQTSRNPDIIILIPRASAGKVL